MNLSAMGKRGLGTFFTRFILEQISEKWLIFLLMSHQVQSKSHHKD
ncbi:hypothetical protein ACWX0P_29635 [Vibrio mediterranei]